MGSQSPSRGPILFIAIVGGGAILLLLIVVAFLLLRPSTPGLTPDEIQATGAAETVSAQLTQVALQQTIAPPPSDTPTATFTAAPPTVTPTATQAPPTSTPECTNLAAFVSDVTIPDNTYMAPNQAFTKTWRLKNAGTCTWTTSYAVVFDSGNVMGGPAAQNLGGTVSPGANVDISVNLVAPGSTGTYRGNWKLRSDKGVVFALGGGGPFYVQIIVGPTPTTGPTVHKSAHFSVQQTYHGDLDSGTQTSTGSDFWFRAVSPVEKYIEPENGAKMLKMAGTPTYSDCSGAALSTSQIPLGSFPIGSWMCYKTNEGRYGRFQLDSISDSGGVQTLNLDMLTWNTP